MKFFKWIFWIISFLSISVRVYAQDIPKNAITYIPILNQQIEFVWPTISEPEDLAGQIEQETCITLEWSGCWNPHAEFKTNLEYGFGLGQLTITSSFNNFTALQNSGDPVLEKWQWMNRYDPTMQIRTLLDMDLTDYTYFQSIGLTETDKLAFMLSAYNGGVGGLFQDIKYCTALRNCNHRIWFGNVETNSLKSKFSIGGVYQTSFYQIDRSYVKNILEVRSKKYTSLFTSK